MDYNQNNNQNGQGFNNSYQYNNYNSPYMRPNKNPMSIASMVCGILSTVCCCFGYVGAVLGIIAVILAFISRKESGKFDAMAVTGLALGIFGAAISIISLLSLYLIPEDVFNEYFDSYYEQFGQDGTFGNSDF